jgi:hypothetical protein
VMQRSLAGCLPARAWIRATRASLVPARYLTLNRALVISSTRLLSADQGGTLAHKITCIPAMK